MWRGNIIRYDLHKPRAFSKRGLAVFLGIPESRLATYKKRQDPAWQEAVEMIEQAIFTQKFELAAVNVFNAGLISRDLGLVDKQQVGGIEDAPPLTFNFNPIASGTFVPTA